ncbi:MAG: hypothetical protein KGJ73_06995, partial [Rhodospirillales bacterium]|nr:hypothetical protein [Rhodospirillales bacterium]
SHALASEAEMLEALISRFDIGATEPLPWEAPPRPAPVAALAPRPIPVKSPVKSPSLAGSFKKMPVTDDDWAEF